MKKIVVLFIEILVFVQLFGLLPNSSLRWIKECQVYNPKVWDEAVEYFDSLEKVK